MQMLIRGWLMYDLTQSPLMVTMVRAAMMMPMLFLSLVGGALADRVDRKMITIAADFTLLGSFAALFAISALGIMAHHHNLGYQRNCVRTGCFRTTGDGIRTRTP